jgi:hypothetical protein
MTICSILPTTSQSHYCLIITLFRLFVCSCTLSHAAVCGFYLTFVLLLFNPSTMFFKRLSRSRSNSQSYIDTNYSPHDSKTAYDDEYDNRPDSARGPPTKSASLNDASMFAQQPQSMDNFNAPRAAPQLMSNGFGAPTKPGSVSAPIQPEPMPDLLTRAFNEAVRPYTNRVEELENEVADLKAWVEQLEAQRREVHAWIDKRGLRPGELASLYCSACACANYTQMCLQALLNKWMHPTLTIRLPQLQP